MSGYSTGCPDCSQTTYMNNSLIAKVISKELKTQLFAFHPALGNLKFCFITTTQPLAFFHSKTVCSVLYIIKRHPYAVMHKSVIFVNTTVSKSEFLKGCSHVMPMHSY